MPDPSELKIGDLVQFTSLPDEWSQPEFFVHKETVAFMKKLIRRTWPSRIYRIDEHGTPWIAARTRRRKGWEYHWWGIFERTGWRKVTRRTRSAAAAL